MKKVILVCGARPNFIKIAPIWEEMKIDPGVFQPFILHTGQHYDQNMSDLFFKDLGLPRPDKYLGVGSASHAVQTAKIMVGFEKILKEIKPDLIIVVGDVNSTLACSIVASKLLIPIAHVESGLRSFDRTMPEEVNRIVTDSIADFLFTTCEDANENLRKEGVSDDKIFFVGNVMIDTLVKLKVKSKKSEILDKFGLTDHNYAILTLHRPGNVDDVNTLKGIFEALMEVCKNIQIIFPVHPRTEKQLKKIGIQENDKNIKMIEPLGYLEFLKLLMCARFVMTDSGGIQEETTYLGIPCLTLRENTERPVTLNEGTNTLVGTDKDKIVSACNSILNNKNIKYKIPELWDGFAAKRIVKILSNKI